MTPLDKPLRRQVEVDGKTYTVTIDPDGLKFTEKGRRKGIELGWRELACGEAARAAARQASLAGRRRASA